MVVRPMSSFVESVGQIIYAVNAGGDVHTDVNGIKYESDPLAGRIGIASDYGKRLLIGRVPPNDHILYQTERYHTNTFGYDIPIAGDGDYVLVLKFCEVYFESPDQKVFDVVLNSEHTIVTDLDIFAKVDKGVAHDEYIPFQINQGKLFVVGEESDIAGGKLRLEFIKGYKDNPKINAFYLMKGTIDDVPKLPSLVNTESQVDDSSPTLDDEEEDENTQRPRIVPKYVDPYESEESSIMLPVFIVVGAFIPVLFCLCKL
ncbi:hypothetical protein GWI33_009076 [Rhynchophorus ferrugineus]|uniref:Malectin domain-containing protein n=1 Tax=Rhynchophorus ferrugineus TaxID=354439 RepID=A0A834MAN4_RHYFE|nr:hypothetical protein GWI33_009076 [Rhynchophorus ferrugineus]